MNNRQHNPANLNNSFSIRQEIQRFESVHPSIYAIYDLIENIQDILIQQQIRDHVVCIEDSFVNSQEWTISRSVPDLKLGILGTVHSGKSALVHRYLTGSYLQEESAEGGRFKKEVVLDGISYLLLIRDEGGEPEMQFTHWVDAVIFVFSLENELSFNTIYSYYAKMNCYRSTDNIPIILVATQDAISESNPRVVDDKRVRKLVSDLKQCAYYETCATYGLNVERVFQDVCQKIVHARFLERHTPTNSRPNTPNQMSFRGGGGGGGQGGMVPPHFSPHQHLPSSKSYENQPAISIQNSPGSLSTKDLKHDRKHKPVSGVAKVPASDLYRDRGDRERAPEPQRASDPPALSYALTHGALPPGSTASAQFELIQQIQQIQLGQMQRQQQQQMHQHHPQQRQDSTPSSTPVPARKNNKKSSVQKSNSFSGSAILQRASSTTGEYPSVSHQVPISTPQLGRKNKTSTSFSDKPSTSPISLALGGALGGAGEGILLQQPPTADSATPSGTPTQKRKDRRRSNLFKKGDEEKTKGPNGQLGSGRTIPLKQGQLYKKSNKPLSKEWKKKFVALAEGFLAYYPSMNDYMGNVHGKEIDLMRTTVKVPGQKPRGAGGGQSESSATQANGKQPPKDGQVLISAFNDDAELIPITAANLQNLANAKNETPNVKKKHKRVKSGAKNPDTGQDMDSDGYEFQIVSLDNKQWYFEATTQEERDEWVTAIEQQILSSLQGLQSHKSKDGQTTECSAVTSQRIREVAGNSQCADCGTPKPEWASLNLGSLICIECSGIHRNLGTHLSRVRSLTLDDWPPELVRVMLEIGNTSANSIWEANCKGATKPRPDSSREEKEKWIRSKYEHKEFLPPPPYIDVPIPQQLIDAIARQDVHNTVLVLAYSRIEEVNAPYSRHDKRTAMHIAAALGNIVLLQLLFWNGANVKIVDHQNHNALWYAQSSSKQECVDLLIQQEKASANCQGFDSGTLQRRRASNQTGPGTQPNTQPNNEPFDARIQASMMH